MLSLVHLHLLATASPISPVSSLTSGPPPPPPAALADGNVPFLPEASTTAKQHTIPLQSSTRRANSTRLDQVLHQARSGLTTALREVQRCRSQKAQCQEQLSACRAGQPVATEDGAESAASAAAESALAKVRSDLQDRDRAYSELRKRAEGISAAAQHQASQLKQQLSVATSAEAECKRKLEGAAQEQHVQQLQTQLGALRRKLEQKEALESTIEAKHSRLTEVYRALEADCQTELAKYRGDGSATKSGKERVPSSADPQPAADGRTPEGHATPSQPCATAGGGGFAFMEHARLLLVVFAAGSIVGWAARGPRGGGVRSHGGGLPHVEEMRGWMPVVSGDTMKIS